MTKLGWIATVSKNCGIDEILLSIDRNCKNCAIAGIDAIARFKMMMHRCRHMWTSDMYIELW